jgi:hypothetical protein
MNYIFVPEDTYTVSAGDYKLKGNYNKTISYSASTNTSEGFIDNLISSVSKETDNTVFNTYKNQNYTTLDWNDNGKHFSLVSNTANLSTENYWMYPVVNEYKHTDTLNFPVTRTISIIINSNTLPVYTIPNDIILGMDVYGSYKELTIPAGNHTYSSIDNLLYNFIANHSDRLTQYLNLPYFRYTRLISNSSGSVVIHDNPEFNKYYGLLHMIYTYPVNHGINTKTQSKKFCANMAPVYRSLHIPEGSYTTEEFINYINNNSEYNYTRAGTDSLSYTQFLAKVVDNDVVIYTNDGTKFFINPICKMNTYKETNFASEHKLCSVSNCTFSYNDFTYNCTNTSYTLPANTLKPVNPVGITSYSLAEGITLPPGLKLNTSTGEITGTVNYTSLSNKYINTTITIKGIIANTNYSIERSFNLYLNFLNIKYNPSTAYIYHQSNKITNIKIEILRGHYSNAWFTVTKAPNDQAVINMTDVLNKSFNSETCEFNTTIPASTIHYGSYYITTYISDTDENGNVYTVSAESIINVYNTPEWYYPDKLYYVNLGEYMRAECFTHWTNNKSFKLSGDSLPSGLEFNSSTGRISGTISPNATIKTYNITVTLTDTVGTASYSNNQYLSIDVEYPQISYDYYIVNTSDTTHEVSISPTLKPANISTISANNLPNGLQINSQGKITGTINYSDTTDGKVSVTITVNGTTNIGLAITDSFNFFVNFMNIDYEINNTIINEFDCHIDDIIVLKATNIRGSITSASILNYYPNLTVTMSDNYDLLINIGGKAGTYWFIVKLTDEHEQMVSKEITINVFERPSLNYNDKYYYSTGGNVLIEPSYTYTKDITWNCSNLPEGLSFNNGIISGKPKYSGDYNITVTLIESLNNHECEYNSVSDSFTISIGYGHNEYTFTVNESVSIIPTSREDYTYTLSGNLPCGLTFGSDGSITGVCDHPVITVLSITISGSDITETVELTLNILPESECKCNIYSRYYVDNELNKCEVVIDKGLCNNHEFILNDNEFNGLVGPYMCILPPNHVVDLNIQTITDDNYETNNNNVNCYIKGFPSNEQSYHIQSLKEDSFGAEYYMGFVQVRDGNTDELIEQNGFDLPDLNFTDIINYFNERSNKQLSITYDDYCIYLHGIDFTMRNDSEYYNQYFKNGQLILEHYNSTTNNKILLTFRHEIYGLIYYNNTICFMWTDDGTHISFDIPSSPVNNGHILCSYVNKNTYPVVLYMDVVSPLAEQNAADLKTMYQVSKFVYEFINLNYDLTEFTIPIGCNFTTTPVAMIEGPYSIEGDLPEGLIFDTSTGKISGVCNTIINSSVNIITSDGNINLTFNVVDVERYDKGYIIEYNETTSISPKESLINYLNGDVVYNNVLPSGCTFDSSTGEITIKSINIIENISINCTQSLTNTEIQITNNIIIGVMNSIDLINNNFTYS